MDILKIIAPSVSLLFLLGMGVIYVLHAKKDGRFTGDEMAKVIAMAGFVFMLVVNGYRPEGSALIFDHTMIMVSLGSVLVLAGIDVAKINGIFKNDKRDNSKDSQ
jgi:hypothetical protein